MLDETFAESIAHRPAPLLARWRGFSGHVILGHRLRPFSFWHAANLDFIQSPFAGHRGNLDFASLYLALKCCRLRYPETIASRGTFHSLPAVAGTDEFLTTLRFGRRFINDPNFRMAQIAAFSAYLQDYLTCGPIHAEGEGSKPVKIPWYLYYVALLVQKAGYTKAQAWDSIVAESQWWITGCMAAEGNEVDILTPQDRADMRASGIAI